MKGRFDLCAFIWWNVYWASCLCGVPTSLGQRPNNGMWRGLRSSFPCLCDQGGLIVQKDGFFLLNGQRIRKFVVF